jgi:hypothetical protein
LINRLRNKYNYIVVKKYGNNQRDAERFYLNLDGYFQNDDILISDDTINALSTLLARDGDNLFEVGSSTVSGTIVDEIARNVFAHKKIDNAPRFKMNDNTFSKLI